MTLKEMTNSRFALECNDSNILECMNGLRLLGCKVVSVTVSRLLTSYPPQKIFLVLYKGEQEYTLNECVGAYYDSIK